MSSFTTQFYGSNEYEKWPEDLKDFLGYQPDKYDMYAILEIRHDGKIIQTHSDGGEPEDNSFFRDWDWVAPAIRIAYNLGKQDGLKETNKQSMGSKIKIWNNGREEVTRYRSKQRWDGDDTYGHHNISGYEVMKPTEKSYFDLQLDYDVNESIPQYLVCVFYNTGDSFHKSENLVSYVDMFQTLDKAKELKKIILQHYEQNNDCNNPDYYSFTYLTEGGSKIKHSAEWKGYFESLNEVRIFPLLGIL